MKVTYNWLKDFVDIKIAPPALAEKLTMAGLEVTSLEGKGADFVFEIEVTSNRPDWLSVRGIAREVAAITGSKLKAKNSKIKIPDPKKESRDLRIDIQDKKDCPLYTAKIIRGLKVSSSPDWLKKRLELIGCRCVNNTVDITNYILFEYGEPLHAFDLDKFAPGKIIVRRAKNSERIMTIDAQERTLSQDTLVIADKDRPVAIAGVMGGKDTEVTESTKNVLLEAAIFNPVVVRRARQRLGLQSESAYRFERGIDSGTVEEASLRAVELIQQQAAGRCVLARSAGSAEGKKKSIKLKVATVSKILGTNIAPLKVKNILANLGFKVKRKSKDNFTVEVPGHRLDVDLEIDLIEEIARIFGYELIPQSLPKVKPQVVTREPRDSVSLIKGLLVSLGLNEVITYSLIDKDLLRDFGQEDPGVIEILNPLSLEQEILRPHLIPSLSRCIAYNLNQKQDYVNIFEIANIFSKVGTGPKEELRLGIGLSGTKSLLLEQGLIKEEVGFLHLKGILEALFARLGIKGYSFQQKEDADLIDILLCQEKIGVMVRLKRPVLEKLDIKNKDVFALELSLERALAGLDLEKKFIPPPKYPSITRDISLILKEDIALKGIFLAMEDKGRPYLCEVRVKDYYKGKQIPAGHRGLTLSCVYRSDARTLTEAEIAPLHALVCGALSERFEAKIR